MPERPYHKSVRLQNFTVFKDVKIDFVPGVNAFVGENGTGKTHLLKALYSWQLSQTRGYDVIDTVLKTFQSYPEDLRRLQQPSDGVPVISGTFGGEHWNRRIYVDASYVPDKSPPRQIPRPVFIPAIDMMGHTSRFIEAYDEVVLDFDLTCRDIVSLMVLQKRNGRVKTEDGVREAGVDYIIGAPDLVFAFDGLGQTLGGSLQYDESEGRFYIATPLGRIAMPLVAEGIRKVATLLRLYQNGWLSPGTTLMWDEPEVNLNPAVMDEVVAAILALARSGVQVFLATHSYVILKELEVQSQKSDKVRFFAFERTDDGVRVNPAGSYLDIDPNAIERQYTDLYDRGIEKRLTGSAR